MTNKELILGCHPLAESLIQQYEARGKGVRHIHKLAVLDVCANDFDELCLLANDEIGADDKAVAMLGQLAADYDVAAHEGRRLTCHLLVQSQSALQMLQTTDLCEAIRQKIDVYPFTMDEVWSRTIVLDYEPITLQSEKYVHLVIFGLGEMAELVAIQSAYMAHYPNYVSNHSLRTRITMIDEQAEKRSGKFIARYRYLFDNSYYRIVKPSEEKSVVTFHKPMYEGRREDFVDVEWEFVEAETWNVDLREKLQLWAKDGNQLLTVVMADGNGYKNLSEAIHLPQEVYEQHIPVYVYSRQEASLPDCSNIHCFGMVDRGYDVTLPLVRMAMNVNYVYDRCYEDNDVNWSGQLRFAVEIDSGERKRSWAKLSNVKRMSSIYNAMTIPSKMKSMGLGKDEWDKFYDIPQQDIDILAQVEHNRWSVEELILGFRPCTDDEQQQIEADISLKKEFKKKKIHYDLRAYNDLRQDETGKSAKVYDLCICSCLPLIAKAFADEEGGKA